MKKLLFLISISILLIECEKEDPINEDPINLNGVDIILRTGLSGYGFNKNIYDFNFYNSDSSIHGYIPRVLYAPNHFYLPDGVYTGIHQWSIDINQSAFGGVDAVDEGSTIIEFEILNGFFWDEKEDKWPPSRTLQEIFGRIIHGIYIPPY